MEVTKKTIYNCIIIICLCIASFSAGRYIRFGRISGTSKELIGGIVLARDTADTVLDQLGIARNLLNSANDYQRLITEGISELQRSNEIGRVCLTEIERTIEDSKKFSEDLNRAYSDYADATERAFDMAIRKSEEYERIIDSLQQFTDNLAENSKESE